MAMMMRVVMVRCVEARLPKSGMRLVRIMWTISVWVSSDSTNHPV